MPRRTEVVPSSGTETWRPVGVRVLLAVLVLALGGLQLRLWSGKGSWAEVAELEERVLRAREEIAALDARNLVLETEVRALKADPERLEGRARSDLGMIRDGETFIMILPRDRR
jgi:cell division protein FtsB